MTPDPSWPPSPPAKDLVVNINGLVLPRLDAWSLAMLYGVPRKVRP